MHQRTKTLAAAVAIAGLAVVGMDAYTYAGTGDSLILGKLNKANKTTHITSTGNGPALSLHAKGNRPALAVDSNAKIRKLNADTVDGRQAAGLQNTVRIFTRAQGDAPNGHMSLPLPAFPNGRYQATFQATLHELADSASEVVTGWCQLYSDAQHADVFAEAATTSNGLTLSGSGVITRSAAANDWRFICDTYGEDWFILAGSPMTVTLTKVDKAITGRMTPTP